MNYRTLLSTLVWAALTLPASAQVHICGTVEASQAREAQYPGYLEAIEQTFDQAKMNSARGGGAPSVYQIPVVVHIVYNSEEDSLSADLVHSQIARLNTDFRRLNADTNETRAEFLPVAADTEIEFYLAGVDPEGDFHPGITWTHTDREDFAFNPFGGSMDEMKSDATGGKDGWDVNRYLNIWVCDLNGPGSLGTVLGFAYPPVGLANWPPGTDAPQPEFEGVVIHYEVFGDGNPLAVGDMASGDLGRTAVHEVGHYLGLRHIWGDGIFEPGCTVDDGLEDTPNSEESANLSCDHASNTCIDTVADLPDMIENYMDYAADQCSNLFTQQQADLMRAVLEGPRAELFDDPPLPASVQTHSIAELSIHPNPSNGFVTVFSEASGGTMEVTDLFGRKVWTAPNYYSRKNVIDLSGLESGHYFIRLMDSNSILAQGRVVLVD